MNIAEILRNAPEGLELYSPICGKCRLSYVFTDDSYTKPIEVLDEIDNRLFFSKEGFYMNQTKGECLLFPKKGVDWGDFVLKNNIGEIVVYTDETTPKITDFRFGIYKGFGYVDTGERCLPYNTIIPFSKFDAEHCVLSSIKYKIKIPL